MSHTGEGPSAEGKGVSARLQELRLGATISVGPLDVTPLLAPTNGAREYRLLHESIADLSIEEAATGNVGRIWVFNRGDLPVLILEGQTVKGAKQNRMVVVSVMVPARSKLELDVGCVERGRWSPRYGAFEAGAMPVAPLMRARTIKEAKHAGKVDQGRLWGDVDALMFAHKAQSPTQDYLSLLERQKRKVEERARMLEPQPEQVGMLVLERGRLVALELLGHADAWRAVAQRLVSSYLLEADMLEAEASRPSAAGRAAGPAPEKGGDPPASEPGQAQSPSPAEWLASLAGTQSALHHVAGLGARIALDGRGPRNETLHGAGLWFGDRPVHLAAFADRD